MKQLHRPTWLVEAIYSSCFDGRSSCRPKGGLDRQLLHQGQSFSPVKRICFHKAQPTIRPDTIYLTTSHICTMHGNPLRQSSLSEYMKYFYSRILCGPTTTVLRWCSRCMIAPCSTQTAARNVRSSLVRPSNRRSLAEPGE